MGRRGGEKGWAHYLSLCNYLLMWAGTSLFRRFTDTNVYGTSSDIKIWKTGHEISVDIRIFLRVCVVGRRSCERRWLRRRRRTRRAWRASRSVCARSLSRTWNTTRSRSVVTRPPSPPTRSDSAESSRHRAGPAPNHANSKVTSH